jgi:dTDP-glucose 4,6-dehydratase
MFDPIKITQANKLRELGLTEDEKKAKELLNWKPKYSGLPGFVKSLEKTIDWFKENNNFKNYNSNIYNI